jgi:hypothetical protein
MALTAPLLKYDLLLARRSFADAFATVRDRLLLLLVAAFLLLWLRDAAMRALPRLPPQAEMLAVLAGPAAFGWSRAALRRLAWFGETSLLAADALRPKARLSYLACAQLPLLAVLSAAVLFLSAGTGQSLRPATLAFLSYGVGVALAAASGATGRSKATTHRPSSRREGSASVFRILLAHQTFDSKRPGYAAASLATGAALATFTLSWFAESQPPGVRLAAALLPSVLLLMATARNAPETVGLLAFAGYPARTVAAVVCALPAANLAAVSAALLLLRPAGWVETLGALLLLHLFAALVATVRAWLSPGRAARRVDLQVQLEVLGLGIVAGLLPPLALPAVVWRLWRLHRHYSSLLWVQT